VNKIACAVAAFVVSTGALLPSALTLPQDGDEAQYGWSAAYFGGLVARLDFARGGSDPFTDPGWAPLSYWSLTQPMGTRFFYAIVLGVTGAEAPSLPYSYDDFRLQGADTYLEPRTPFSLCAWPRHSAPRLALH